MKVRTSRLSRLSFAEPDDDEISEFLGLLKSGDPATEAITISPVPVVDPPTAPQPAVQWLTPHEASQLEQALDGEPEVIPQLKAALTAGLVAPSEPTPICDSITRGWSYLFAIRCAFPAAAHETPILCGMEFRDSSAATFPALRQAAWSAGWRTSAGLADRWACPACAQTNPAYESLYPVTIWAPGTHEAREHRLITDYLDRDGWPLIAPDGRVVVIPAENALRAQAEHRIFEGVMARRRRRHHRKIIKAVIIP